MKNKLFPILFFLMVIGLIAFVDYNYPGQKDRDTKSIIKKEIKSEFFDEIEPRKVFKSPYINLAFFGLDKTEERIKTLGCFRTDTIIVMQLDLQNKKVYMLSIPRDTYVFIPKTNRMDKINHAFPYGGGENGKGFESSINTIESFLGIKIDHYIGMDMEAIKPIVNAAGGVKLNVDLDYNKKGYRLINGRTQILDGKTAYFYVRYRYTPRGDIDRIGRQQRFIKAFLNESSGISMEKGIHLYKQLKPMFYTDMTFSQIASLGYYFKTLKPEAIDCGMIDGNFMNLNGISYWNPDIQYKNAQVNKIFLTNSI